MGNNYSLDSTNTGNAEGEGEGRIEFEFPDETRLEDVLSQEDMNNLVRQATKALRDQLQQGVQNMSTVTNGGTVQSNQNVIDKTCQNSTMQNNLQSSNLMTSASTTANGLLAPIVGGVISVVAAVGIGYLSVNFEVVSDNVVAITTQEVVPETTSPTATPTTSPTTSPTMYPTLSPSMSPTGYPTEYPTISPTDNPTTSPTFGPTFSPTVSPTFSPTVSPTFSPTVGPTFSPTFGPTFSPTVSPSFGPTTSPTTSPSTEEPTPAPTTETPTPPRANPISTPEPTTEQPTPAPTTAEPTEKPSESPTNSPSASPTNSPSASPTANPTANPTATPTAQPSIAPTALPTTSPTQNPTSHPSVSPTDRPSVSPEAGFFICLNQQPEKWTDHYLQASGEYQGNLLSVDEQEIQDYLEQHFGNGEYWIGYTDRSREGQWRWMDGSGGNYVNWALNEPTGNDANKDCATTNADWEWQDADCNVPRGAFYQYPFASYQDVCTLYECKPGPDNIFEESCITESPTTGPSLSPTASPSEHPTAHPSISPTQGPSASPTASPTERPVVSIGAFDDAFTIDEDQKATGSVLDDNGAGADKGEAPFTVSLSSDPSHGSVTISPDGQFEYTPDPDFYGEDSFEYKITDAEGAEDIGNVTITVNSVNDAPVAEDIFATTREDAQDAVVGSYPTADAEGDPLTLVRYTQPEHGTVTTSDDKFIYNPDPDYWGPDSFQYTLSDGTLEDTGTVTIDVEFRSDPPEASDDDYSTIQDMPITMDASAGVLSNDMSPEGYSLFIYAAQGDFDNVGKDAPTDKGGTIKLQADGSFVYTPPAGWFGTDGFNYFVSDGNGGSHNANVRIVVNASPTTSPTTSPTPSPTDSPTTSPTASPTTSPTRSPTDSPTTSPTASPSSSPAVAVEAFDDAFTIDEDKVATGSVLDDNGAGSDRGEALTVSLSSDPSHGSVAISTDGQFEYTPDQDFYGEDTFEYKITDPRGAEDIGKVTITVNSVNDAPVAEDISVTTREDAKDVVVGSYPTTDVDGDPLSIRYTQPEHGTVTTSDNNLLYNPDADYSGPDSFQYTLSDGTLEDTGTVTIDVEFRSDPPVATSDDYSTDQDVPITMDASAGVLSNDFSPEGYSLFIYAVQGSFDSVGKDASTSQGGTVKLQADGSFVYTPPPGWSGTDGFNYFISDGNGGSHNTNVRIVVNPPP